MSASRGAYLIHHGIRGQKWGEKNGPPYPLDFDKLSPEEREKAKADSIAKGDTVTAQANLKYYSAKEIDELIIKNNANQRLSHLNGTDVSKGEKFVKNISNFADKYVEIVDKGSKVYNVTAKVTNALGLTDLTLVGDKGKSKEERNLEALKFKKDLLQVQNEIKEAEQKRDKLNGKGKDKNEELLKKLKREADMLEQKAKYSEFQQRKDKADYDRGLIGKPKVKEDNRSEEDKKFDEEMKKMNQDIRRAENEAKMAEAKYRKEHPEVTATGNQPKKNKGNK